MEPADLAVVAAQVQDQAPIPAVLAVVAALAAVAAVLAAVAAVLVAVAAVLEAAVVVEVEEVVCNLPLTIHHMDNTTLSELLAGSFFIALLIIH